jgi:hypothetical protein
MPENMCRRQRHFRDSAFRSTPTPSSSNPVTQQYVAWHQSPSKQSHQLQSLAEGIHGKFKRAGVHCVGIEGSENESGK